MYLITFFLQLCHRTEIIFLVVTKRNQERMRIINPVYWPAMTPAALWWTEVPASLGPRLQLHGEEMDRFRPLFLLVKSHQLCLVGGPTPMSYRSVSKFKEIRTIYAGPKAPHNERYVDNNQRNFTF